MVRAEWKNKGLGVVVLKQILYCLAEQGYRKVRAVISEGNMPSERIFRRAGFERVGVDGFFLIIMSDGRLFWQRTAAMQELVFLPHLQGSAICIMPSPPCRSPHALPCRRSSRGRVYSIHPAGFPHPVIMIAARMLTGKTIRLLINRVITLPYHGLRSGGSGPLLHHRIAHKSDPLSIRRTARRVDGALPAIKIGNVSWPVPLCRHFPDIYLFVKRVFRCRHLGQAREENDPLAVGREVREPVLEIVVGELLRLTADGPPAQQLHRAGAGGVEVDVSAVVEGFMILG